MAKESPDKTRGVRPFEVDSLAIERSFEASLASGRAELETRSVSTEGFSLASRI